MNNEKIGQFILELRKSNHMTQKDLAAKLNITDKAISKWERGLNYPDISLLPKIADVFGVTTSELLNGEKNNTNPKIVETSIDNAIQYADKTTKSRVKSFQSIFAITFSLLLFIGAVTCTICDIAISGNFTWSLFPISSIVFAWLVFFPAIKFGKKGIIGTMVSLTVLIVPFLYVLDQLIQTSDLLLPIGIRTAAISAVYLWVVYGLFKTLKSRKVLAAAISLLTSIPIWLFINFSISTLISEPQIDVWDIMAFSIIATAAIILFIFDYCTHRKAGKSSS